MWNKDKSKFEDLQDYKQNMPSQLMPALVKYL